MLPTSEGSKLKGLAHMANFTTYCIYRIVCFPTAKIYVGQSKRVQQRQSTHFQKLRKNKHHSQKLQAAFNKYGESAFFAEVIEANIPPDKINERESHWIAFYNSFRDGYNMTPGGQDSGGNFKAINIGGTQYSSKQAASEATGLTIREIDVHLRNHGGKVGNYKDPEKHQVRLKQRDRIATKNELTIMAIRLGLLKPSGE